MLEVETDVSNLPVNKEKAELVDQKPFVIRGHHLKVYLPLIKDDPNRKKGSSPAIEARILRRIWEAFPSTADYYPTLKEAKSELIACSQDIIGTSTESADRYEERIRETFEKFISLPDDYPAELIEEMPDAMCEACAVGEHCRSRSFSSKIHGADMSARESEHLDKFLKNIKSLNLPEPVISYEQAHFPDADPEQVRRIKTTIGIVRRVLRETDNAFWSQEK